MSEAEADDTEQAGEMSDGLQVELFHPESDRSVGDTNKVLLGGRFDGMDVESPAQ